MTVLYGPVPVVRSNLDANAVESITFVLGKVTINGALEKAVFPPIVTEIGW